MKVKLNVQNDGVNTLKEKIEQNSNKDLKKVYMLIGNMKESGFDILEEFLIDLKARKFLVVGIDKKNTTRRMLEQLLKYTKNVYVFNNNYDQELDASIYVFEYTNTATIFVTCGSMSGFSLTTDVSYYTQIEYDLTNAEDKEQYKEYVDKIVKQAKQEPFVNIDKEYVTRLVEDKEIFSTKQYTHNVMSIAELLKKNDNAATNNEKQEKASVVVPKIDLSKINEPSFDIDLGDIEDDKIDTVEEEEIKFEELKEKEVSSDLIDEMIKEEVIEEQETVEISDEVIDMESILFEKANVTLSKPKAKTKIDSQDDSIKSKKVDLEKISNLFIELPQKSQKGKDVNQIRVPNYIKDMIENFFEGLNDAKLTQSEDGINEKKHEILVEVIDVNSDTKYKDKDAFIVEQQGKTYVAFVTDKLSDIYYEEGDIARIIKLSSNNYHIEIIPKTAEEYNIWKKLCTKSLRGSTRMYGVM